MNKTQKLYPPSLERSFQLLDLLTASSDSAYTIKEFSEKLDIPYASTYRIVKCMEAYGFLMSSNQRYDRYKLGHKLISLGKYALSHADYINIAVPYLSSLSEKANQACRLSTLTRDAVILLDQTFPQDGIMVITKIGEERAINTSSAGRLLVSFLTREKRRPYIGRALAAKENTHLDRYNSGEKLNAYLDKVQSKGYCLEYGENSSNIGCISMPLFDYSGEAIAAISFSGHIAYYTEEDSLENMRILLQNATREISAKLGYPAMAGK
jgi:DNA-binding IclR family transcriptional regulator